MVRSLLFKICDKISKAPTAKLPNRKLTKLERIKKNFQRYTLVGKLFMNEIKTSKFL